MTMIRILPVLLVGMLGGLPLDLPRLAAQNQDPPAGGGSATGGATDTDVKRYEALIDKMRRLDAEYQRTLAAAKDEVRERNGDISHTTATQLTNLQDELDLTRSQLVAIAAMTGRPVPDLETLRKLDEEEKKDDADAADASARRPRQATVIDVAMNRAMRTVRGDLQAEANEIARRVRLPIAGRRSR